MVRTKKLVITALNTPEVFYFSSLHRRNLESALFDRKYKHSKRNDDGESFDAKEAWKMCLVLILLRS